MRDKYIITTVLFLFIGISIANGQLTNHLVVVMKDGTQQNTSLTALRKITVSEINTILNYNNGVQAAFADLVIRKFVFSSTTTASETVLDDSKSISIYPNPASNYIQLKNLPSDTFTLVIYRPDGSMVLSTQLNSATTTVDISTLAKGFYLLKVNNQAIKLMKL
jgi:hypothetical protein